MPRCDSERVERVVDIYESADAIRGPVLDEGARHADLGRKPSTQITGRDGAAGRPRLVCACLLLLLCVVLLAAVAALAVKSSSAAAERDQAQERYAAAAKEKHELLERMTRLRTDLNKPGWVYFSDSVYYMSTKRKSWEKSRQDCMEREADLVIVNTSEEQGFLKEFRRTSMAWIGLSGGGEGGTFKWLNGSGPTFTFWGSHEPSNFGGDYCVRTGDDWRVDACSFEAVWICEKQIHWGGGENTVA